MEHTSTITGCSTPAPPVIVKSALQPSYDFVDTLRFWSMFAIVAVHCIANTAAPQSRASMILQAVLTQAGKFGTIAFFVCAGLLLGSRVSTIRSTLKYFWDRFRNIGIPWLIWVLLLTAFKTAKYFKAHTPAQMASHFWSAGIDVAFHTSYWFVPNLLLCLALILIFRKYLEDLRFGLFLLVLNSIYVVNIYQRWFESDHSSALFAFILYLWLGALIVKRLDWVRAKLALIPNSLLLTMIGLSGMLALAETYWLGAHMGLLESLNTLRLFNQVFSLCVIAFCLKMDGRHFPRFVRVRKVTYGTYLSHPVFLAIFQNSLLLVGLTHQTATQGDILNNGSVVTLLGVWIVCFGFVYGCSFLISNWLADTRVLAWTVGQGISKPAIAAGWRPNPEGAAMAEDAGTFPPG